MPKASDISKQVWKFQEGLVYLALTEISSQPNTVHWNFSKSIECRKKEFTPDGMSIDPDIVIGNDRNAPESMVFVTHASMEHGSEKKFWRTVPEAIEEKALASHPKVLSVLYAGNVKASIMEAYEYLFDGVYHLDQTAEGVSISALLMELTKKYGSLNPLECLNILKGIRDRDKTPWKEFYAEIARLYNSGYGSKHSTLVSVSGSKTSRVPVARRTSLRQSICKLTTLPETIREQLYSKNYTVDRVPTHAVALGWFNPVVGKKFRLVDPELIAFLSSTPKELIEYEIEKTYECGTMIDSVHTLQLIDARSEINKWIIEHFDELVDPSKMYGYLNEIFFDEYSQLKERLPRDMCPTSHWLFESIMSLLRTETGRADGYGYSSLAEDAGETNGITGGYIYVADFSNRKNSINYDLNRKIANAFSSNLIRLGRERTEKLLTHSVIVFCKSLFNYNISTYRKHNPIDWLVCKGLDDSDVPYIFPTGHPSFLSDELSGMATSTNNIIKIGDGSAWIKCQSAYNGKTDKRKELCGRIGAMKLKYSSSELSNVKFYLVIDGYYDDIDLSLLDKAGWDGIFYYDEIDQLIQMIKSITPMK